MAEKVSLTPDQTQALEKARESALRIKTFADKARSLGLPVLESYLRDASVSCQAGADFQERAFRDNALQQPAVLVIDDGAHCLTCGSFHKVGPCPSGNQADAIADAMKRRGLFE